MRLRFKRFPWVGREPWAALLICGALALCSSEPAAAQSLATGTIAGVVSAGAGRPLVDARVEVRAVRGGLVSESNVGRRGAYRIAWLPPGEYDLRFEALGYAPMVVSGVAVSAGGVTTADGELRAVIPPVTEVDSVSFGGHGAGRLRVDGSRWIGSRELSNGLNFQDSPSSYGVWSPSFDQGLGAEGLPGSMTQVYVDGIPMPRIGHPILGDPSVLSRFPSAGLGAIELRAGPADVEFHGASGGYLSLASLGAAREGFFQGVLRGTGGSLATTGSVPEGGSSATSFWGSASGGGSLSERVRLIASANATSLETPSYAILPASSSGFDGDVALTSPWVEKDLTFSGALRIDGDINDETALTALVSGARNELSGFPLGSSMLGYGANYPLQATDVLARVGLVRRLQAGYAVELKAAFSSADRTFSEVDSPSMGSPTWLPTLNRAVGAPGLSGEASVKSVFASSMIHYEGENTRVKLGGRLALPWYRYSHWLGSDGEFLVGTPLAGGAVGGSFYQIAPNGSPVEFSFLEFGGFGQYTWEASSGVEFVLGVSYDSQDLPRSEVVFDSVWHKLSGVRNDVFPRKIGRMGSTVGVRWTAPGAGTSVVAQAGLRESPIDASLLNEALASPVEARRSIGTFADWPEGPSVGSLPFDLRQVTILSSDLKAPRSARGVVGIRQPFPGGALHVGGVIRQTEYLARRRDLNRAPASVSVDALGRPQYGTLAKEGSVIGARTGSGRRFEEYDFVWAVDSDGWSKYKAAIAGIELATGPVDLFARYVYSQTEDNWVGARAGHPEAAVRFSADESWNEGTSDFDVPHRLFLGASAALPGAVLRASVRHESGLPYTPLFPVGVDANGDGSSRNDVPLGSTTLAVANGCMDTELGYERNSCRGPATTRLDVGLGISLDRFGVPNGELSVDVINVTDAQWGIRDQALFLVDPAGALTIADGVLTIPTVENAQFGSIIQRQSPHRAIRVGLRVAF